MKKLNLVGQTFGRLTVIEDAGRTKQKSVIWRCRCECGAVHLAVGAELKLGMIRSCGCLMQTHGYTCRNNVHPLYHTWYNMIRRCTNPKDKDYKNYGGRGIKVCERWMKIENFLEDVKDLYIPELQMDRIKNDGNYEPGNIKWSTAREQASNRRR